MAALIIGVCGGTGAGKTMLATRICEMLTEERAVLVQQDHYYKDLGYLSAAERACRNFDHPEAIDIPLMVKHVNLLRQGQAIDRPVYDFTRHTREQQVVHLHPRPAVIVEGTLLLGNEALCELIDLKLFLDTDPDIRFIRRLRRDIRERGRTPDSIIEQYLATVRPMHNQFIEPFKQLADLTITNDVSDDGIDLIMETICSRLRSVNRHTELSQWAS